MKKKSALLFSAIVILLLVTCLFVACNKSAKKEYSNVSRSVSALYAGESETFAVTFELGQRERNFLADGIATDVADFSELTVQPLKTHDFESVEFTLTGENGSLTGTVGVSDFGEYRLALTKPDFTPLSVTLTAGELSETVDLQNMLDGKLTSADVINLAKTEFADRIAEETADGAEFKREVYVKLITGDRESYYYYVSFIGDGMDYWALLVNPESGEVVSKK